MASQLRSGVSLICSTRDAFAALKADGSVVTWGSLIDSEDSSYGGDSSAVASQLSSGVVGFANPFTNDWLVSGSPSSISLAISPAQVTEDGTTNLVYTFSRTGPTTSALTVYYAISGTADSSDYTGATPGAGKTISFAAGSATSTLTIDPTADTSFEPDETVALTLAVGTGYTVATTAVVVGTILNDDTIIEAQGNTKLLRRGDGMAFVEFGAATRQQINSPGGANVGSDSSEWQMVAAETIAGTNQILWRNNIFNYLHLWNLDANWIWQSSSGADGFNTSRA